MTSRAQQIGRTGMTAAPGEWPRQFLVERECKSIPRFDKDVRQRMSLPICVWIIGTFPLPQLCNPDALSVDTEQAKAYHRELGLPALAHVYAVCRCQGTFLD